MSKVKTKTVLTLEELQKMGKTIYALIYRRVSSKKQEREGHGLDAQKQRCVEYAARKKYVVSDVMDFPDTASGGGDYSTRQGQVDLLKYIDRFPHRDFVVIVDDPSRLARDVKAHFAFRDALKARGVRIESPNFNFDDSPEGEVSEGISAVISQYNRKANRRQVIQKMKERLEAGYWAFGRKKGYDIVKDPLHGKLAVANKEGLEILKPALEMFARGELPRKIDFARYLLEQGFWSGKYAEKYLDQVTAILTDCFYMGDIEYLPWEVARKQGKHSGIISASVFESIQHRLSKGTVPTRVRRDIRDDMFARGLVNCVCNAHMTAAWSKGRSGRYVYYYCTNRECEFYRKSLPAKKIEDGFNKVLKETKLKDEVEEMVDVIFDRVWKEETASIEQKEKYTISEISNLTQKVRDLTDMARKAKNEHLKSIYEKELEDTSFQLERLRGQSMEGIDLSVPYRTALEKAKVLLKKPYSVWKKMEVEERHELFFFIFDEKLVYDRESGYQTANIPTAARLFENYVLSNSSYVDPTGIEPVTSSLQMRRSTR